jgi:carboxyl-terminal processing protease
MMKWYKIFFLLSLLITPLFATTQMRESDIRRAMDRLFSFHIENKELTPLLVKRCFKLYIEQFDPEKSYLLDSEIRTYMQMDEQKLAAIVQRMQQGDYKDFKELNQTLQGAIFRAQGMRTQMANQLLSGKLDFSGSLLKPQARYAQNEGELFERQQNRLLRFYLYYQGRSDLTTVARKAKLLSLFDRKAKRMENQYLFLKFDGSAMEARQVEHLSVLRILKSFAKSLDTHTSFFSPEEAHEMRLNLEKQFEGVGVILFEGVDGVQILDLVKGSPADQSGQIRANDLLVEIDGLSTDTYSFDEILDLLKKGDSKNIVLGVKRFDSTGSSSLFRVQLQKKPIVMKDERITSSYEVWGDGVIGKISLYSFYESGDESCERDIKAAIREFQKIGPVYGLVLDLRENAGGFLSQAVKVSGIFLSNGVVVISKYSRGEIHFLRNIVGRSYFSGPLVILTSKMSASASEIVAQALQDYGVGVVVGDERTFGKGSIQYQTVTDMSTDLFFKVTVGKYYTASGRTTQIEGVKADIVVPTHYAPYHIGERYLEYPLTADRVEPAFVDPLSDLDEKTRRIFVRKYMPYLQRVVSFWKKVLPTLQEKSKERIAKNPEYQAVLRKQSEMGARLGSLPPNSVDEMPSLGPDLQMIEAVSIVKDMIQLQSQAQSQAVKEELLPTGS